MGTVVFPNESTFPRVLVLTQFPDLVFFSVTCFAAIFSCLFANESCEFIDHLNREAPFQQLKNSHIAHRNRFLGDACPCSTAQQGYIFELQHSVGAFHPHHGVVLSIQAHLLVCFAIIQ